MVELALALPILLILVLGIVDFGRAINYWNDENQIAEVAARIVAVGSQPTWSNFPTKATCTQPSSLSTFVAYEACLDSPELSNGSNTSTGVQGNGTPGNGINIAVCYPTNASGGAVRVTITAAYKWLPLPKVLGGSTQFSQITLSGSATMRLENQISGTWVPASVCS